MAIKKSEQTMNRILNESYKLFSKKGYNAVTMTDICEATKLSRGGLYRYFANTDEIFNLLLERLQLPDEKIKEGVSAVAIMDEMFTIAKNNILNREDNIALATIEYVISDKDNQKGKGHMKIQYFWHNLLTYGISTHEFKECDVEKISDMILFFCGGLFVWGNAFQIKEELLDSMFCGIRDMIMNPAYK